MALVDDGPAHDFPERMLGGIPAEYFMGKKLSKPGILGFFDPEAFAEYVRCFNWKTIKGSCADYRAAATIDCELDTADLGRKLDADPGAVGCHQQRRQAVRRSYYHHITLSRLVLICGGTSADFCMAYEVSVSANAL